MAALREVNDLTPFEDAKLLGHNATHALGAFLGKLLGLSRFGDLRYVPGAMAFLRAAFIEESGRALVARYAGVGPPFTPADFVDYADDLLARMVNPYLADSIERTARDLRRKLGWDDRLVGLMRLGLAQRVPTPRFAMGAAAGLELLRREGATGSDAQLLGDIWSSRPGDAEVESVLAVIAQGGDWLASWQRSGFNGLPDHV
jgi:mannitol-1-phosphate/altronate dehydrogenase